MYSNSALFAPKYLWGAPLRQGSQGCITNLSHQTDIFTKTFC